MMLIDGQFWHVIAALAFAQVVGFLCFVSFQFIFVYQSTPVALISYPIKTKKSLKTKYFNLLNSLVVLTDDSASR